MFGARLKQLGDGVDRPLAGVRALEDVPRFRSTQPVIAATAKETRRDHKWIEVAVVTVLVLAGLLVRAWRLDYPALFIDEAESTLNAMSILERGYPSSSYMGLPIYENTLTRTWPESAEYEFRDSSYSDSGVAIYHGWLPLYSMAASLKLFGITPDVATAVPHAVHGVADMSLRTLAPRVPAVLFAGLFLVALYLTGKAMMGRDAGLVALFIGAFARNSVYMGRQARYYSATLAIGTCCLLLIWLILQRGAWKHYLGAAICFGLLFHTHLLSFLIASVMLAAILPFARHTPMFKRKVLMFGLIVAAFALPWLLLTGFLTSSPIPSARATLAWHDYLIYPMQKWPIFALVGLALLLVTLAQACIKRLPERLTAPFLAMRSSAYLLCGLIPFGYIAFILLIPAVSCFLARATLPLLAPSILLGAMLLVAVARVVNERRAAMIAMLTVVLGMMAMALVPYLKADKTNTSLLALLAPVDTSPYEQASVRELVENVESWHLPAGAKVYSVPHYHFALTYYTGLPVQSVAPVRKAFLDHYPNEVVLIDTQRSREQSPIWFADYAAKAGHPLTSLEAKAWSDRLAARIAQEQAKTITTEVHPGLDESVPAWVQDVVTWQHIESQGLSWAHYPSLEDNPAIFRGHEVHELTRSWIVLYYRYVDPDSRGGEHVNYADRIRGSRAEVLESSWTIYFCPPLKKPVVAVDATRVASATR